MFFSLGEEVLRAGGGDHGGAQQEEGGEGEDGRGTVLFIFRKCLTVTVERFSAVRSGVLFKYQCVHQYFFLSTENM